ncbi:hypothetical protein FOA52_000098 [Chlamydomonas sp. UWO 241]|nr:hypothetical protein FOA52_000098 [Chlamydomonas sp. UWO 241]
MRRARKARGGGAARAAPRGRVAGEGGDQPQPQPDDNRTRLGEGIQPLSGGGGIFKSAAVAVLRQERKLMTTGEITKVALERKLIQCQGKTPEATMASALYTDVKRKLTTSVFTRPQEGMFGLREWIGEGFYPDGWIGPKDDDGLAPFKKRHIASPLLPAAPHAQGLAACGSSSGRPPRARAPPRAHSAELDEGGDEDEDGDDADAEDDGGSHDDDGGGEDDDMDVDEDPSGRPRVSSRGRPVRPGARGASGAPQSQPRGGGGRRLSHSTPAQGASKEQGGPLDSPLKLLGEVAELTKELSSPTIAAAVRDGSVLGSVGHSGADGSGGSLRRNRRPAHIQVPNLEGGMVDASAPKSPYEDSLAALHEIATSPQTYAGGGLIDNESLRRRRRASTHDGGPDSSGSGGLPPHKRHHGGGGGQHAGGGGGHSGGHHSGGHGNHHGLVHHHQSPHGGLLPEMLLDSGLDSSRVPLISFGGLTSPAGMLGLDSPSGLLTGDTTPGMLAAALSSAGLGALVSPSALLHGLGMLGGLGMHPLGMHLSARSMQPSLPIAGLGLPVNFAQHSTQPHHGHHHSAGPSHGHSGHGGILRPGPAPASPLSEIGRVRSVVEKLEARMGDANPQVGKAWLSLARMYQHVGARGFADAVPQAADALTRARAVARRASARHALVMAPGAERALAYLMAHGACGGGRGAAGAGGSRGGFEAARAGGPDAEAAPPPGTRAGAGASGGEASGAGGRGPFGGGPAAATAGGSGAAAADQAPGGAPPSRGASKSPTPPLVLDVTPSVAEGGGAGAVQTAA